jgi:hypothetical protein
LSHALKHQTVIDHLPDRCLIDRITLDGRQLLASLVSELLVLDTLLTTHEIGQLLVLTDLIQEFQAPHLPIVGAGDRLTVDVDDDLARQVPILVDRSTAE